MGPAELMAQQARLQGVLEPGSTFGVYIVRDCIGEGGMARIYRAEHAGLRRQVALKVLINGFAREPEGRERFVREARIAAAIKHPNVVNIFDVGVYEDVPYLVMELLEGTDLESFVQSKGPLDESVIIDIMVPIVAGLAAVHEAGIVHRDLKPGNIFLSRGRYDEIEPKLLDFGISKAPDTEQAKLTMNGLLMGTPFYMSPEGLRGEDMTPLSDQYSLGVVMYECVTGRAPFAPSTFPELANQITTGQYLLPTQHNPTVSKRLERIIVRAMSLDPKKRFSDFREMGRELLLLAGQRTRITWGLSFGETSHTRTMAVVAPPPESIPNFRPNQWRKPIAAIVAGLGIGLLANFGLPWSRSSEDRLGKLPASNAPTNPAQPPTSPRAVKPGADKPASEAGPSTDPALAANHADPRLTVRSAQTGPTQNADLAQGALAIQGAQAIQAAQASVGSQARPHPAAASQQAGSTSLGRAKAGTNTTGADSRSSASADDAARSSAPAVRAPKSKSQSTGGSADSTKTKVSAAKTVSGANGAPIFD
ncbi:MAG TPA: protein kinase [Polyangiaceae bacterium]|nr:protein kinase [Polyangiaceae bacterium]